MRVPGRFKLRNKAALVLLGDALNVFNHDAHQDVPSRIGDSPNYELATGFVPPRRVMLGAKLTF